MVRDPVSGQRLDRPAKHGSLCGSYWGGDTGSGKRQRTTTSILNVHDRRAGCTSDVALAVALSRSLSPTSSGGSGGHGRSGTSIKATCTTFFVGLLLESKDITDDGDVVWCVPFPVIPRLPRADVCVVCGVRVFARICLTFLFSAGACGSGNRHMRHIVPSKRSTHSKKLIHDTHDAPASGKCCLRDSLHATARTSPTPTPRGV